MTLSRNDMTGHDRLAAAQYPPVGSRRPLVTRALVSWGAIMAVARRPSLWLTAARVGRAVVAPGWWRSWPFLPLPPGSYADFRAQTMYGRQGVGLSGEELIDYLKWCQWVRSSTLRSSHARSHELPRRG